MNYADRLYDEVAEKLRATYRWPMNYADLLYNEVLEKVKDMSKDASAGLPKSKENLIALREEINLMIYSIDKKIAGVKHPLKSTTFKQSVANLVADYLRHHGDDFESKEVRLRVETLRFIGLDTAEELVDANLSWPDLETLLPFVEKIDEDYISELSDGTGCYGDTCKWCPDPSYCNSLRDFYRE